MKNFQLEIKLPPINKKDQKSPETLFILSLTYPRILYSQDFLFFTFSCVFAFYKSILRWAIQKFNNNFTMEVIVETGYRCIIQS